MPQGGRKLNAPAAGARLGQQGAPVRLSIMAPVGRAMPPGGVERLEHPRHRVGRHARPVVLHRR